MRSEMCPDQAMPGRARVFRKKHRPRPIFDPGVSGEAAQAGDNLAQESQPDRAMPSYARGSALDLYTVKFIFRGSVFVWSRRNGPSSGEAEAAVGTITAVGATQ